MELGDLLPIGVTLVVVGLVLSFGLQILSETKTDLCGTGYTYNSSSGGNCMLNTNTTNTSWWTRTAELNATDDATDGLGKFTSKIPLLATVVIAVVIITVLIKYFTSK